MGNERPVLVTGAAGFIGGHTARALVAAGTRVIALDRHPTTAEAADRTVTMTLPDHDFADLLAETRPRALIHCAGRASVGGSMVDPGDDFRTNTAMTFEILEAIRTRVPDCHLLFPSSAAVYGDPSSLPVSEDAVPRPVSPYGFHKLEAETLCREYTLLHGVRTTVLRVFSAYGPGLRRQVVWDICRKALTEPAVALKGTGGESRDFVFVDDIAAAFAFLIQAPSETPGPFNLGTGTETRIDYLADALVAALEVDKPVLFDGQRPAGDPMNWRADISAISALGFTPRVPVADGLPETARWVRDSLS